MTPELSAVVLCYRAGDSILRVIEPLYELLRGEGISFELVLVANYWPGQGDPTPAIVDTFGAEHDNVVVVSQAKQGAMGWDMRSGFAAAGGEIMIVIDGDAQNPVDDVVRLYRLMRETGAPVGKGRRITRYDGVYRRAISIVYNLLFRALFRTGRLWDINGKPKGIRKDAYEQMSLRTDDWFADAEIVLEAQRLGMRIVEVPVVFHRNDERASFVRPSAIWEFIRHMARYRLHGAP
jgi:cellulose synthase/poly-beta-1,6-N-acetylglucosamine synthase-like glycosyltransferase